jgi:hypothetical protein
MDMKQPLSRGQLETLSARMKQAKEEKFLEASRKRLTQIVTTKIRTSFIGALAAFEENFGDLWGKGIPDKDKTPEQLELQDLWDKTRTQVLNSGNTQLRAATNEISNHIVHWNRYTTELKISPDYEKNILTSEPKQEN